MVRDIMHDPIFLSKKAEPATKEDKNVVFDLIETLKAHENECVGMAANMIGVNKAIIVFSMGNMIVPMINPMIIKKSKPYETEEGCLSIPGTRRTTRYDIIEVEYYNMGFTKQIQEFRGWTAQIIQHEIDHLNGILI